MLKRNLYVYGEDNSYIPAHGNYGKYILSKMLSFKDKTALIDADSDQTMTYYELAQQTVDIALSLSHMGVKKGQVIGICSEKRMEIMPTMLGIVCTGATFTPLDVSCGEASFLHRLNIARPSIVFCSLDAFFAHENLCANGERICVVYGEAKGALSFSQFLAKTGPVEQFLPAHVDGWVDDLFVIFSSGTTGLPKGIRMTHFSFLLINMTAINEKEYFGAPMLNTREWYYTYGLLHTVACLHVGSTVVFSPRNRVEDLLQAIQKYKIKIMQVCPTTVNELVKCPILPKYDVCSLMYMISTSTPCDAELLKAVKDRFPNLREVYQLYGMSEAGLVCSELLAPYGCRPGSVGCAATGVVIKVVDVNTRVPLGPYRRGEICLKSLALMKGYIGVVEKKYLDEEEFYMTGDIGYYDEDKYFYIVDRVKEMIKYYDISSGAWSLLPNVRQLHSEEGSKHYIRFDKPQILAKEHCYLPRMIREAIEIKKYPNFNREDGWKLAPAWDPVLHLIKSEPKKPTARPQDTVAPAEFEAILLQHPAVKEAGVVGAPHAVCGEVPTAFVVLQPGAQACGDELVAYVNSQISYKTKLVGGVRFVNKLPRGAGEKLDRNALRHML